MFGLIEFFGNVFSVGARFVATAFREDIAESVSNWMISYNPRLSDAQKLSVKQTVRVALAAYSAGRTDEMWRTLRSALFLISPMTATSVVLSQLLGQFPGLFQGSSSSFSASSVYSSAPGHAATSFYEPPASSSSSYDARDDARGTTLPEVDGVLKDKYGIRLPGVFGLSNAKRKAILHGLNACRGDLSDPITFESLFQENSSRLSRDVVAVLEPNDTPTAAEHEAFFVYFFRGSALLHWLGTGTQTNPMTRSAIRPDNFVRLTE
eukprot:ANDGO_05957.mRNA.1 hypothetical protein